VTHQVGVPLYSRLLGCTDWLPGKILGLFVFNNVELILSKPFSRKGNHHHPTDEEREARDKRLFVYCYNQGGEKTCRDNSSCPYPSYTNIRHWLETSKCRHDQFSVRTDLANRPTELMLVSFETWYTKLWGNRGFLQSGSRQTTPVRVGVTCGSGISVVRVVRKKGPR